MSKKSTVNIDRKTYEKIKEYCNDNSYKISSWAENILIKEINKKSKNKSYEERKKDVH